MNHSSVLPVVIVNNNIKKFAEIGVWKSHFMRSVLRSKASLILKEYWAIDRWDLLGREHGHMGIRSKEDWDSLYLKACRYMPHFPQLKVVKMESKDASNIFRTR